jgi:hypothetical protein
MIVIRFWSDHIDTRGWRTQIGWLGKIVHQSARFSARVGILDLGPRLLVLALGVDYW